MTNEKSLAEIKGVRRKVLTMAFWLLVIIMFFTGFLNYMTFTENYNNSLVNTYSVAGNELVRKIEYALYYGKPIDNYYGMNETLNELKDVIPEVEQLKIVSPSGNILYDLSGFVRDSRLPGELLKTTAYQGKAHGSPSLQFYKEKAYVFTRINDNASQHVASLVMVFPRGTFLQFNSHFTQQLIAYLMGTAIIALTALFIVFFRTRLFSGNLINKKKVLIALIVVIGSAQLLYSGINYLLFKSAYIEMSYTSQNFIQEIVEKNIDGVYSKGLSLENIEGFDKYLGSIKESMPQIEDIYMIQQNKVAATISIKYIDQQMFRILLDMLTVLVISILFMIEITLLAVIIMAGKSREANCRKTGANPTTGHGLVRSLIFFVNLCACMSLTFIPIVMKSINEPVMGLPEDIVLGLPLSAEMLGGIVAIILAGWTINKKGWRTVLYFGVLCLMVGNLLSGLSTGAIPFILSRAVVGLGLGQMLMAIRSLVVSLPESNIAIAEFGAGAIAGLNCGAVIGGMLADRIGYDAIFYIAAVAVVIPFIFVRRLMTEFEVEERQTSRISALAKFINFIADKKAIIFLVCIFIPYFVSGAFLDYCFPLFASGNNLSQSDISRGFLLNGLFIIYLGPVLTRYVLKMLGKINGMIVSMIIVACALASFMLFGTIAAAFVTIILLGIAESFGVSMKTTYFLDLKGIKDLEINKGIAYFSAMVNMSRMAGPILYGLALSLGMRMGVGLISFMILMLLLVFVFFNRFGTVRSDTSESA